MSHARRYFNAWATTTTLLVTLDLWMVVQLLRVRDEPYLTTAVIWLTYLVLGSLSVGVWRAERLALLISQLLGWALLLLNAWWWLALEDEQIGYQIGGGAVLALHAAGLLYGLAPRTRAAFGLLANAANA